MGGSITKRVAAIRCSNFLGRRFPQTEFSFINAGISSTCSTGTFRLHRDVLSHGPIDLFFIEFAVNDDQDANPPRWCILGMEEIIRQIRTLYPSRYRDYLFRQSEDACSGEEGKTYGYGYS